MAMRWRILVLLFLTRCTMAFQFGTVGALGPVIGDSFQVDAAAIGFLVGLYLSPGLVVALPGGAIGRILGDKRAVLAGLALMTVGGVLSAFGTAWEVQVAGRILAGTGGVVLNVLMSKMVTDWFAGREIATAMALFVNSWPAGIALALVAQPLVATMGGIQTAFLLTAVLSGGGFAAILAVYRQPQVGEAATGGFPGGAALACILLAGMIWGLFNAAFAMVFSFGPLLLTGLGWGLAAASSATSIAVWLGVISVPAGGVIADRTGRPGLVMVVGMLLTSLSFVWLARTDLVVPALIVIGLVSGLPVGAIMSLPSRVLAPSTRAMGMGLFFTLFYGCVVAAPLIAGALIELTERNGAAMDFGAAMLLASIALLALFNRLAGREFSRDLRSPA